MSVGRPTLYHHFEDDTRRLWSASSPHPPTTRPHSAIEHQPQEQTIPRDSEFRVSRLRPDRLRLSSPTKTQKIRQEPRAFSSLAPGQTGRIDYIWTDLDTRGRARPHGPEKLGPENDTRRRHTLRSIRLGHPGSSVRRNPFTVFRTRTYGTMTSRLTHTISITRAAKPSRPRPRSRSMDRLQAAHEASCRAPGCSRNFSRVNALPGAQERATRKSVPR